MYQTQNVWLIFKWFMDEWLRQSFTRDIHTQIELVEPENIKKEGTSNKLYIQVCTTISFVKDFNIEVCACMTIWETLLKATTFFCMIEWINECLLYYIIHVVTL